MSIRATGREDLVSNLQVALDKQVKSNPLTQEDMEDYQARQKWEKKIGEKLSAKFDTNVAVSCWMRRSADEQGNKQQMWMSTMPW